jgi:hypothetical protein
MESGKPMSDTKKICVVVTLHGVGFEQPPLLTGGTLQEGYADSLHRHLKELLDKRVGWKLGDDPNVQKAGNKPGVIYVQSCWTVADDKRSYEEGLKRLGSWSPTGHVEYDNNPVPSGDSSCLISDECDRQGFHVAHVALVYSDLETTKDEFGATLPALGSLFSAHKYGTFWSLLKMGARDIRAIINKDKNSTQIPSKSAVQPRRDISSKHEKKERPVPTPPNPGLFGMLKGIGQAVKSLYDTVKYLKDDVACYVYENDERHRVQSFVREALTRLAYRSDVDSIVLNTHSNGTVVAFDVLCQLPSEVTNKVKAFVTAGSPLRKYITLFSWGTQVECHYSFLPWYNFWDECDPVADKLNRLADGPQGGKVNQEENLLFWIAPNGKLPTPLEVCDIKVDNVHKSSGGGLQAHNYWDNENDFVPDLVRIICGERPDACQLSSETPQEVA